jgi:AraC-like DNA-binding protein
MTMLDHGAASMRLSSCELEGPDRNAAMRELFGRGFLNIDIDFVTECPSLEAAFWQFPGVTVGSGRMTGTRIASHDPASGSDAVILGGGFGAPGVLHCRGREVISGQGNSALMRVCDAMSSENHSGWLPRTVRIDAALIEERLTDIEDRMVRVVPGENPALQLLDAYLPLVCNPAVMGSPRLAQAAAEHLVDLVVLAVGACRDSAQLACGRGLAAARSATVREWVRRRQADPGLSLSQVAQAHRLSPRTIQAIFHAEQTSFTEYLLQARLDTVHRLLADRALDGQPISSLAFAAGFNDLSYFNRRFRERFARTPSDVRAGANARART